MSGNDWEGGVVFEIAIALPKWGESKGDANDAADCVEVLIAELRKKGLLTERVVGLQNEFIKLAAPLEILGKAAAELKFRKKTHIGMDFAFEWDEADAFVRLPDGSLFSWRERFLCYKHLIYAIVNNEKPILLNFDHKEVDWNLGEPLVQKLESIGIVKEVFPLHDENKRKQLLRSWAMNWSDFTSQPTDDICSYFGIKIATYFTFLGMYTKWMLFPAALGLTVHLINFGSFQFPVLPFFFVCLVSWAVLFFQFWKRKNAALSARLKIYCSVGAEPEFKSLQMEMKKQNTDRAKEKATFQKEEWFQWLKRFRNDTFFIMSIICLQLPFELAYAHLYEVIASDLLKFSLTAVYLITIQYFTRIGGKISVKLIKYENNDNVEYCANSLVYKVFGLYFMQSYIGIFYHVLLHRNMKTLRHAVIQRLVIFEVIENLLENSVPYLSYSFKKFWTVRNKRKREQGSSRGKPHPIPRVEKDYLKPAYVARIGQEIEDGLFDDFLELVLQFGLIMMFACAFPLAFAFAAVNNITEIRADALKLLAMMRRPLPRADATIGAWLNIFQFLIVMSICTNSVLLVCLYDQEGKWNLSPGLAAILIMEHLLLFIKFGFSRLVPEVQHYSIVFTHFLVSKDIGHTSCNEWNGVPQYCIPQEPAWVRAARMKNVTEAEKMCSKQLLRNISGDDKYFREAKKND